MAPIDPVSPPANASQALSASTLGRELKTDQESMEGMEEFDYSIFKEAVHRVVNTTISDMAGSEV